LASLLACWSDCTNSLYQSVSETGCWQVAARLWALLEGDLVWLNTAQLAGSSLLLHDAQGLLPTIVAFMLVTFRGIGQGQ
jgi:hypothetical protein